MKFRQLNPHACRSYLVGVEGANDVAIVDPVVDHVSEYLEMLSRGGLTLALVVDTHTHADHISGAAALKDATGCSYLMHENGRSKCADFRVADGFAWKMLDAIPVRVMHTPGHTKDSISLVLEDRVLTGDALFLDDGGAGRDDLPGGDPGEHWESLRRLSALPDDLLVYPAHDYRKRAPSSIGRQKKTNPHLKPRSKGEFIRFLEDLRLGPADWMKDVLTANYACARDPKAAWIPVDSPACEVKGTLSLGVNDADVSSLPAAVLKQRLASDAPPVLIDVREEAELSGPLGHLDGIVHIPIGSLAARLDEVRALADRDIVTVCRSGARAHTAAQILKMAGVAKVSVLAGGMVGWQST
jgi:sulfur dioxygenase